MAQQTPPTAAQQVPPIAAQQVPPTAAQQTPSGTVSHGCQLPDGEMSSNALASGTVDVNHLQFGDRRL
jgi:hypothetical protein